MTNFLVSGQRKNPSTKTIVSVSSATKMNCSKTNLHNNNFPPCSDANVMADSGIDDIKDVEILVAKGNLPLQRLLVQIPEADKGTLYIYSL